jgi:hypothetical protein
MGDSTGQQSTGSAAAETSLIQAGISIATTLLIGPITKLIKGCGPACVQTSAWANQAEALLKQNLDAWQKLPTRTASMQAAFLQNFDTIWQHLESQCNQVQGAAGINCIGDRNQGACHYTNANGCWNWFVGYRDPIANDPSVVPDSVASTVGSAAGASVSIGGSSIPVWGLLAAGLALFFIVKGS